MKTKISVIEMENPQRLNLILGQSHFIKTVEDLYEILITSVPGIKFGLAFCEASGDKLVRSDGNDQELIKLAEKNAMKIAAGHTFIIFLKDAYPINVLNQIKNCQEVCRIFCATSNPLQVIVAETSQGRGILGVIDGEKPVGIETEENKKERKEFLRKIMYKR
ncbi:MAG: adenosine-specific kinase [Candidatus Altiarchaeota archaeon]